MPEKSQRKNAKKQCIQASLFDYYVEHEIGQELKSISMILDQHREILDWVESDLQTVNLKDDSGRKSEGVQNSVLINPLYVN